MTKSNPTIAFKSNLPTLVVLEIYSTDLSAIQQQIKQKKASSPMMFAGLQVLLDCSACQDSDQLNLSALKKLLVNESILPIGIMTEDDVLQSKAQAANLGQIAPILRPNSSPNAAIHQRKQQKAAEKASGKSKQAETNDTAAIKTSSSLEDNGLAAESEATVRPENLVIERAIRSGQRIYAKGDLTILGSVSVGAEVIADGNIHIYGALNGRAMAGASGREDSHIFCKQFNAEIVAIAGNYLSSEDLDAEFIGQATHILLRDDCLEFFTL